MLTCGLRGTWVALHQCSEPVNLPSGVGGIDRVESAAVVRNERRALSRHLLLSNSAADAAVVSSVAAQPTQRRRLTVQGV